MNLEIVLRVSEEKVVVEVPEKGWRKEFANLVVIHREKNLIVDLGQTIEEMQAKNPQRWEEDKAQVKFLPMYDPVDFDPEISTNGLRYFKTMAFQASQSMARQLVTKTDLTLWLPGDYLATVGDSHEQFEYILQEQLNLRALRINGLVVGWHTWQRKLVRFYTIIPIFLTFLIFLKLFPIIYPINSAWISTIFSQMAEPWHTLNTVINFVSTFILLGLLWCGLSVLLLLIYRFFIPKPLFLIHQASFPSRGGVGEKAIAWFVEKILVDEPVFTSNHV